MTDGSGPPRGPEYHLGGRGLAPSRLFLPLLFTVNTMNFFDRLILGAISEPVRKDWSLSDTQLGWLTTAFTLLYAVAGLPLGRLADTWRRKHLLAIGVGLWGGLTYACGLCTGFWSLFSIRLGVGIGEAVCAPVSSSLIGDLFPPQGRARAMSVFMAGLPLGVALSYVVSGTVAQHYGWRAAFFVAGAPGLVLALLLLPLREPPRGEAESRKVGAARRPGSPYRIVLGIPTMRWIIVSGALHNFGMYAISFFLPAFLVRYHHTTVQDAGFISGTVIGGAGAAGMFLGGWFGDRWALRRPDARLLLAASAVTLSVPPLCLAISRPEGSTGSFVLYQSMASMMLYVYYAAVYSTLHDVVEPALRGTATAVYFLAMYLLGASLGPLGTGLLSDHLALAAALSGHAAPGPGQPVADSFKAVGLHQAMYLIPVLCLVLAAVLLAGAKTVRKDAAALRSWMDGVNAARP